MQRKEVSELEARMSPNQLLRVCSAQASLPGIRKALDQGADVNYHRGESLMSVIRGTTAIETSLKKKIEAIKYLESRGADLAISDGYAIDHAVDTGSIPLLLFLLKKIPAAKYDGIAIFGAIHNKNMPMLELLLKHGITLSNDVRDEVMSSEQRELLRSTQERLGLLSSDAHSGGESLSSSAATSMASEASAGSGVAPPPARPGRQSNTGQADGAVVGDKDTASASAHGNAAVEGLGYGTQSLAASDWGGGATGTSAANSSTATTRAMCMTHIEYDNPIFNDNARSGGRLFNEALRVGGIKLVDALIERSAKRAEESSASKTLVVYRDTLHDSVLSAKLVGHEHTKDVSAPSAVPATLHLDTTVNKFNVFVDLVNQGREFAASLIAKAQELLNAVLNSPNEGNRQNILTTLLLDMVDALNTQDPMTFFPAWGGGHDDEPGDFGGGGYSHSSDSGDGGMPMFGTDTDNTTNVNAEVVNTSVVGDISSTASTDW